MAEQELFFIKPTAKVQASSESRSFYDVIVNENIGVQGVQTR